MGVFRHHLGTICLCLYWVFVEIVTKNGKAGNVNTQSAAVGGKLDDNRIVPLGISFLHKNWLQWRTNYLFFSPGRSSVVGNVITLISELEGIPDLSLWNGESHLHGSSIQGKGLVPLAKLGIWHRIWISIGMEQMSRGRDNMRPARISRVLLWVHIT